MPPTTVLQRLVLVTGIGSAALAALPVQSNLGYLKIVTASVVEGASDRYFSEPASRRVFLRWVLAGRPTCDAARRGLSYTFLIDSDASVATGQRINGLRELGLDRRVTARCDATSGLFTSPSGRVAGIDLTDGRYALELETSLGRLPSAAFRWVALARDGARFTRFPQAPSTGAWSIAELAWH